MASLPSESTHLGTVPFRQGQGFLPSEPFRFAWGQCPMPSERFRFVRCRCPVPSERFRFVRGRCVCLRNGSVSNKADAFCLRNGSVSNRADAFCFRNGSIATCILFTLFIQPSDTDRNSPCSSLLLIHNVHYLLAYCKQRTPIRKTVPNSLTADIAIIGSGFAGSLTATILKKLGFTVVLLDKSTHPRFAIGESSTPIGNLVLRDFSKKYDLPWLKPLTEYGLWRDYYPHLRVGRKRGFSYFKHIPQERFTLRPDHGNELLVAASKDNERSDTHWFRADVDAFLFKEAQKAGVMCYEDTMIEKVRPGSSWRLSCKQAGSTQFDVKASFVIDATGRAGALAHFLQIPSRVESLRTNTRALYSRTSTDLPSWHNFLVQQGMPPQNHPYYCDDAAVHHLAGPCVALDASL